MKRLSFPAVFRTALSFGAFQAFMPFLGWLAGRSVVELISGYDHWLAFVLLSLVGSRMIWESFRKRDGQRKNSDITRGFLLLVLSVATSIDALAIGLSFAFLEVNILPACITIGVIAFVVTVTGFLLGKKAGGWLGKRAEVVGGLILIGIGLRILLEHIL